METLNGTWIERITDIIFNKKDITKENFWHICGTITDINTEPIVLYTPPAGKRFAVTDIVISVNNDNVVRFREGNNGCKNIFVFNVNTQANSGTNMSHSFSIPYISDVDGTLRITNTTTAQINYALQGYFF